MFRVRSWWKAGEMFARYFAYRAGLAKEPVAMDYYLDTTQVILDVKGWNGKPRYVHPERCPHEGPVIFVSNHTRLYDPFIIFHGANIITDLNLKMKALMRDDFFRGTIFKTPLFDLDAFLLWLGALPLNRDSPKLSQLKAVIDHLAGKGGIVMFPGRTRSRSGMVFEYREAFDEPGGISFFVFHAQRRNPGLDVAVVPMAVNTNPVNGELIGVYGETMHLARDATREERRAFDFDVVYAISGLIEINVGQVLSATLYLYCLHNFGKGFTLPQLETVLEEAFKRINRRNVDPKAYDDLGGEIGKALKYLASGRALSLRNDEILVHRERVLNLPDLDTNFVKGNPARFLTNQILHLADVVRAAEDCAFALGSRQKIMA